MLIIFTQCLCCSDSAQLARRQNANNNGKQTQQEQPTIFFIPSIAAQTKRHPFLLSAAAYRLCSLCSLVGNRRPTHHSFPLQTTIPDVRILLTRKNNSCECAVLPYLPLNQGSQPFLHL